MGNCILVDVIIVSVVAYLDNHACMQCNEMTRVMLITAVLKCKTAHSIIIVPRIHFELYSTWQML